MHTILKLIIFQCTNIKISFSDTHLSTESRPPRCYLESRECWEAQSSFLLLCIVINNHNISLFSSRLLPGTSQSDGARWVLQSRPMAKHTPSHPSTRNPVPAPKQKQVNNWGQGCVSVSGEGRGQEGTTEPYITGVQSAKEENKEERFFNKSVF